MPSDQLLVKAKRFIVSATLLSADGDYDSAASRLYYALFFVVEVLLATRGYTFSSHKAVISAFGQYFAKNNKLDSAKQKALLVAFTQRQLGDYAVESGLSKGDIEQILSDAKEFPEAGRAGLMIMFRHSI